MRANLFSCVILIFMLGQDANADRGIPDFIGDYCIGCHGSETQKADRRFDLLPKEIQTLEHLEQYQEIIDQLNLEAMPPRDEPQPTAEERSDAIAQLTLQVELARAGLKKTGGHSALRRLNAWEYRHTVADLLGINVEVWNPSEDFPKEVEVDGFDNNGAALVTSGTLMDHFFTAAEALIQRSTQFSRRPESRQYTQASPFYFEGKNADGLPKLFHTGRFRWIPDTPYTDLYGRHYRGGHLGFLPLFRQGGVEQSGIYTIRVRAAAVGRVHDYGKALGDFRNGDPLVMELAAVDRRGSVESNGSVSKMTSLSRTELTNEEPRWFEWKVYMEAGYEPEVRFRNGPLSAKRMVRLLTTQAADQPEFQPFINMPGSTKKGNGVLQAYQGPRLRIWEIQMEGPEYDQWPPLGHQALYGNLTLSQINANTITDRLEAFATKAFRRPPYEDELEPILELVANKIEEGMAPLESLQLGFQAILCSPGFLYINLPDGKLDEVALASRLSYFLWSSAPDDQLLQLARSGKLRNALRSQVERLLADPKSDRFVRHFIRRWLELDNIGTMPPSEDFLVYYRDNLETAMKKETELFFKHILNQNLPLTELLDADYSFLNRELALHYGIQGVQGNEYRKVSLQGSQRGGLTGQGIFLTASANGVDTSPVVRGIYVLEKLLGYTPPPPPPDVPGIDPDIRGAVSIREQLEKHREVASCAECHKKIDPLGFALENYDAIGAWRESYDGKTVINAAGQLPDGSSFQTVGDFRKRLMASENQFKRCLTEKLVTYALGREVGVADRVDIDQILAELDNQGGGLRDLIRLIVMSELFQNN